MVKAEIGQVHTIIGSNFPFVRDRKLVTETYLQTCARTVEQSGQSLDQNYKKSNLGSFRKTFNILCSKALSHF